MLLGVLFSSIGSIRVVLRIKNDFLLGYCVV
jgi:hypothetical protein